MKCWSQKISGGDSVVHAVDPRHTGRVFAIIWSTVAKVRWDDSGFISELPLSELRRVRNV